MSPLIFAVSSGSLTFTIARVADLLTRYVSFAALYTRPVCSQCDTDLERAKTNTTKHRTTAASLFSLDDGGVSRGLWWRCIWWRRGRGAGVERAWSGGAVEPTSRFKRPSLPAPVLGSSRLRGTGAALSRSSRSRAARASRLPSSARVLFRFRRGFLWVSTT